MKLSDKILMLRKQKGMSQEELAGKLNLSRQAISRWENGSAQPDAKNILRISQLFGVSADYLLNEEDPGNQHLPKAQPIKEDGSGQIFGYLILLEILMLILQFMCVVVLKNVFFGILSFVPFAAMIGGWEYAFRKKTAEINQSIFDFRKKFYKISAWLGCYFPIRLLMQIIMSFFPIAFSPVVRECMILVLYITAAMLLSLTIDEYALDSQEAII